MKRRVKIIIASALLVFSIGFIVYGSITGGYRDVKNKAIRICYECIGIG